jgi:hypothetical protein
MKPVYVVNKYGKPLMPCHPAKARILLKQGKAKAVRLVPFTIRLLYDSTGYTQPVTLGIDTGYEFAGLSAVTDKKELFSAEVQLRTDIPKLLSEKRMYRRSRRNRLWYRPARFDNRKRPDGWLAPSIQHKLDSHIKLAKLAGSILPITQVIVETAAFDIQKINNPGISGTDYQNGVQKDFWNTKEYVLHRDGHTCQACKGKNKILNVHHIVPRSQGGTDKPDNLITLCESCHKKLHAGRLKIDFKPAKNFKAETLMSTIRWKLVNTLRDLGYAVSNTYGYLTKDKRMSLGLEKTHANDAFCIAGGERQLKADTVYFKQVRRNNRSLEYFYDAKYIDKRDGKVRKGKELSGEFRQFRLCKTPKGKGRRSIRRTAYAYHPYDKVKYNGRVYTVLGVQNNGDYVKLKENQKAVRTELVSIYKYASGFADVTREVLHKKQNKMSNAKEAV